MTLLGLASSLTIVTGGLLNGTLVVENPASNAALAPGDPLAELAARAPRELFARLAPEVELVDDQGAVVRPVPSEQRSPAEIIRGDAPATLAFDAPTGRRTLRIRTRCQPVLEQAVEIGWRKTTHVEAQLPAPAPAAAWVGEEGTVARPLFGPEAWSLPRNARVTILREFPTASGACTKVIVRLEDVGVPRAQGRLAFAERAALVDHATGATPSEIAEAIAGVEQVVAGVWRAAGAAGETERQPGARRAVSAAAVGPLHAALVRAARSLATPPAALVPEHEDALRTLAASFEAAARALDFPALLGEGHPYVSVFLRDGAPALVGKARLRTLVVEANVRVPYPADQAAPTAPAAPRCAGLELVPDDSPHDAASRVSEANAFIAAVLRATGRPALPSGPLPDDVLGGALACAAVAKDAVTDRFPAYEQRALAAEAKAAAAERREAARAQQRRAAASARAEEAAAEPAGWTRRQRAGFVRNCMNGNGTREYCECVQERIEEASPSYATYVSLVQKLDRTEDGRALLVASHQGIVDRCRSEFPPE